MFLDEVLISLLNESKKIAIVGAKDKSGHPVDMVGRFLIEVGYTVYPVHPARSVVWGLTAYKELKDLPTDVDIVNVFRAPAHCPAHAQEVLRLQWKPKCFWMQEGIRSSEAGRSLSQAAIKVVEDLCIKTEYQRLILRGKR